MGVGKAREVPDAIRKASDQARKEMVQISILGSTIPHAIEANFGAGKVLLKPASPGTGVIAGGGVRAVVEACGINDILSKSLGSDNILNVVQATFVALQQLQDFRREAENRGRGSQASGTLLVSGGELCLRRLKSLLLKAQLDIPNDKKRLSKH